MPDDNIVEVSRVNILFVCTGNTCRSPMAEAIFRETAQKRGLSSQFDVRSCGLAAENGAPAAVYATEAVRQYGADLSRHRAQCATGKLLDWADWICCMSSGHQRTILHTMPELSGKVLVFDPPVPDPFGGSLALYQQTAADLKQKTDALLEQLYALKQKANR